MADTSKQKEYVAKIRNLIPINALSAKFQKQILSNANIVLYRQGKSLFKQGSQDHFSFYLLEGELQMERGGSVQSVLSAGSPSANYPVAQLQPRRFTVVAKTDATVLMLNRHLVDKVIVLQEKEQADVSKGGRGETSVKGLAETKSEATIAETGDDDAWMVKMLESELFSKIPTANIYKLFEKMQPVTGKAKDVIVRQGEAGDSYYVIRDGTCAVLQKMTPGKPPVKLADLGPGASFGEEALVSKGRRNASVVMTSNGTLMKLNKKDFDELITKPTLKVVSFEQGSKLVEDGALWLDVRFPSECRANPVAGSLNVPIYLLRNKVKELDQERQYVVCCDNGERSSTAAFLLTQQGFEACYVGGGLQSREEGAQQG